MKPNKREFLHFRGPANLKDTLGEDFRDITEFKNAQEHEKQLELDIRNCEQQKREYLLNTILPKKIVKIIPTTIENISTKEIVNIE